MTPRVALAPALLACLAAGVPCPGQSLYSEQTYRPLTSDHKAYRVGDLITVLVMENSSASSSTDTSTKRNNALNGSLGILSNGRQYGGSLSVGGSFDGGGTTQRANKLLATLSVNVVEILPSGEMRVGGDQHFTVNGEQQTVRLEGRIRPTDIAADNSVPSTRLADARITYVGKGELSERQQRGLWRRLLDWMGL